MPRILPHRHDKRIADFFDYALEFHCPRATRGTLYCVELCGVEIDSSHAGQHAVREGSAQTLKPQARSKKK
jgi:hypothetical protein